MVLPKLLGQIDKDFDICIWCNDWQKGLFDVLSPRIKTFTSSFDPTRRKGKFFVDFIEWKDLVGIEKYDIQIGVDSDDLIREDFVQKAKEVIAENYDGGKIHLSFIPYLFDLKTMRTYHTPYPYHEKQGSPFMALYQRDKGDSYKFIYHDSHLKMHQYADKSISIPAGYCWFTTHDYNESTQLRDAKPL